MDNQTTYRLGNSDQLRVSIIPYGGRITSILVPDKRGSVADVVLGYNSPEEYESGNPFFGSIIGRVANRINKGKFSLHSENYELNINNPPNHLHGGVKGFHNQWWTVEDVTPTSLRLSYYSGDGEENYPGNLHVIAQFIVHDNELSIAYSATTDQPTPVNLTHHSFFNLAGESHGSIEDHVLQIIANAFTPIDHTSIPTGIIQAVDNTPFDFRTPLRIGKNINAQHQQLLHGNGYDHNWVLNKKNRELTLAARVSEPTSGRTLEVHTTEMGLQFYSGNFLDGTDIGKSNKAYNRRSAFCLEPQGFPNAINQSNFPTIILLPDQIYQHTIVYRFGCE